MSDKISIIIPCYWNSNELVGMTFKCVESMGDYDNAYLTLVDDGSPIKFDQEVPFVLERNTNGGYAAAVNSALQGDMADIFVVGNNDLIFPKNWLEGLLSVLDEGFDVATCWTSDQKYKLEPVIKEGDKFGSIFAMKREVYDTIGGFDEQFRGYFSDDDYRIRLKEAGFRIGMNYNLVIGHQAKATYSEVDPDDKEFKKSKILFEIKHGYQG